MIKLLLAVVVALSFLIGSVQARPEYYNAFYLYYGLKEPQSKAQRQLAKQVNTFRCNVCHVPERDKRLRNEYGIALSKLTPVYNANEWQGQSREATYRRFYGILDRAAKETNSEFNVDYGEMIKNGFLPAPWE